MFIAGSFTSEKAFCLADYSRLCPDRQRAGKRSAVRPQAGPQVQQSRQHENGGQGFLQHAFIPHFLLCYRHPRLCGVMGKLRVFAVAATALFARCYGVVSAYQRRNSFFRRW